MLLKVSPDEAVEFQPAQDGPHAGEIVVKRINKPEPVLAIVDFNALE